MNGEEEPVKDIDDIPDNQSEVSSIMSSRTEYHELPTRSTVLSSTGMSAKEGFPLSDLGHSKTLGKYVQVMYMYAAGLSLEQFQVAGYIQLHCWRRKSNSLEK